MSGDWYGIYVLVDPTTFEIRYVGKSHFLDRQRFRQHLRTARKQEAKYHSARWIRTLLAQNLIPQFEWIDWCSSAEEACEVERLWIAYYRNLGVRLTNITAGGGGLLHVRFSEETRKRISIAVTGKTHTPEVRARLSAAKRGRPRSPEAVAKTAAWHRGKIVRAATRAKMSASQRGRKPSPKTIAAARAHNTGRKYPPAHLAAMSRANRGKKLSLEHRAKIGAANRGRVPPPHVLAASYAARLRYIQERKMLLLHLEQSYGLA